MLSVGINMYFKKYIFSTKYALIRKKEQNMYLYVLKIFKVHIYPYSGYDIITLPSLLSLFGRINSEFISFRSYI